MPGCGAALTGFFGPYFAESERCAAPAVHGTRAVVRGAGRRHHLPVVGRGHKAIADCVCDRLSIVRERIGLLFDLSVSTNRAPGPELPLLCLDGDEVPAVDFHARCALAPECRSSGLRACAGGRVVLVYGPASLGRCTATAASLACSCRFPPAVGAALRKCLPEIGTAGQRCFCFQPGNDIHAHEAGARGKAGSRAHLQTSARGYELGLRDAEPGAVVLAQKVAGKVTHPG